MLRMSVCVVSLLSLSTLVSMRLLSLYTILRSHFVRGLLSQEVFSLHFLVRVVLPGEGRPGDGCCGEGEGSDGGPGDPNIGQTWKLAQNIKTLILVNLAKNGWFDQTWP